MGYLVFTEPPPAYNILSMLMFVVPVNVGPTLMMPDMAPTVIVFLELFRNHADTLRVWRE